jgi:hypothetical protein
VASTAQTAPLRQKQFGSFELHVNQREARQEACERVLSACCRANQTSRLDQETLCALNGLRSFHVCEYGADSVIGIVPIALHARYQAAELARECAGFHEVFAEQADDAAMSARFDSNGQ